MSAPSTLPATTTPNTSGQGWSPRTAYTPPSSVMVSPGKGGTTYSSAAATPNTSRPSRPRWAMKLSRNSTMRLSR
ncbi:hypothetical protein ACN28S_49610 [Cystobacter fuscus]